jgi:hypothetical protein
MPEDDIDMLVFDVASHPDLVDSEIVMAWCEIAVLTVVPGEHGNLRALCNVLVNASGQLYYDWDTVLFLTP